ncbi:hypothetical protein BGZ59_010907 [Podila verticillata]|nr:hypothetical protein BGZ59_010907 [Podila verticillata]
MPNASKSSLVDEPLQGTKSPKSHYSLKVSEILYKTHDIAIPRNIPPWTDADTAMLDTVAGFNIMTELLKEDYMFESYSGIGYVLCAGDGQLSYLVTSIQSIREVFKSNMPIQVFYAGDQDLSPSRQEYIRKITGNIEVIDITLIFDNGYLQLQGWAIKSFALLASKFENAMVIDADDPSELFDGPAFKEVGALFFYDRTLAPYLWGEYTDFCVP